MTHRMINALRGHGGVLIGVILVAGVVDFPASVSSGSISGLGLLTIAVCVITWIRWAEHTYIPVCAPVLFIGSFALYASLMLACTRLTVPGVQNLMVFLSFFGLILLSYREARTNGQYLGDVQWALTFAASGAMALYAITPLRGADDTVVIGSRSFRLFALIGLAHFLSQWRFGNQRALWGVGALILLLFLSMSRTAFVVAVAAVPVSVFLHGGRGAWLKALGMMVLASTLLGAAVFLYEPLYQRFFAYDASMEVGGVAINASGRTDVWEAIYESFTRHMILGQGPGSTSPFTDLPGVGHPHNDYLLIAHDYGLVGLSLWATGVLGVCGALVRRIVCPCQGDRRGPQLSLAALLALATISVSMITDNPVTYIFVMAPLGVLVGAALGYNPGVPLRAGMRRRGRKLSLRHSTMGEGHRSRGPLPLLRRSDAEHPCGRPGSTVQSKINLQNKARLLIFAITLFLPAFYVILEYYLGLNNVIVNLSALNGVTWADSMPLAIEYLVFSLLFCGVIFLSFGKKGLVGFSLPALFAGLVGVLYTIDNVFPYGQFTPFQC